jgi:predicted PurR-regulated permease PerM
VNGLSKLEALRVPFAKTVKEFQHALKELQTGTAAKPPKRAADPEIQKVEIHEPAQGPFEIASAIGGPLLSAGGSIAAVFLLVIFFLIYKTEIRDRVIRLAGDAQVNVTTQAITEATRGVSHFLFLQAIVNTSYGIVFGAVLFGLGVPGAFLWGFLAAVLRFVPYLGPITAGALPILLSLAVFPGWNKPIMVAGFIIGLEIVLNNLVEPIVYGRRTGLSPLAVVLAAVFWAWMWGGIGLILAVPLTVCLVSLGKYAPSLRFLTIALGDEPALDPKVQVYHRLLGRLQVEATELLEKEMADAKSLSEFYDSVLLPVLRMAETDIQIGKLDDGMAAYLIVALREIVDDLADSAQWERGKENPPEPLRASVLCLPAGSKADELSAHMLAQVLTLQGRPAKALGLDYLADKTMETVKSEGADLLVICTTPPSNLIRARYLYKRLRRRFGDIAVVQGVWGGGDARPHDPRIVPDGKATLVFSFVEAENAVGDLPKQEAVRSPARLGVA